MRRIVLVGNPNVGKSVVFSQLTGARVMISNYAGTTVEVAQGQLIAPEGPWEVLDSPGTYSLEPTNRAEEVTASLVDTADVIINVVDATNLERNLLLTTGLLEKRIPVLVALNMVDEAGHKGIEIDRERLESRLGVPVIPTVALSGEGIRDVVSSLHLARPGSLEPLSQAERWSWLGNVVEEVQRVTHRHHTWLETLQDASLRPVTGLIIASVVMFVSFNVIIGVGRFLEEHVMEELVFDRLYAPLLMQISKALGGSGFWHDVLIGRMVDGEFSFEESLGVLTTGVFVEFGIVLPFLFAFYVVLGFLEDSGYMPRLAVILDRAMHRLGLHGYAIIPMVLGFGCNVPAALSARNLESRRERFIACTLMAVSIPCMAQIALIVGLVGRYGGSYLLVVFASLFFLWVVLGLLVDRSMTGYTPSMVMEIPPYRVPHLGAQMKKLSMRIKHFIIHATPYILGGVLAVNILYILGIMDRLAVVLGPVMTGLLGLPEAAVTTLLIGFLRKDVAVAMLEPLGLTAKQFVVGATVLAAYFPCAATFTVLVKELGTRDMIKSAAIMLLSAFGAGAVLNIVLDDLVPAGWLVAMLVGGGILLAMVFGGTSDRREIHDLDQL